MGKTLAEMMAELPVEERAAVEAEACALIAEELTLREVRTALELTQAELAETLGLGPDEVSRLERRADMLVSTLRRFIAAMGGDLDFVARFPGRPPVHITHLGDLRDGDHPPTQGSQPAGH